MSSPFIRATTRCLFEWHQRERGSANAWRSGKEDIVQLNGFQYDDKWKNCYTDSINWTIIVLNTFVGLQTGISSNFFTDNRNITLNEARVHVLKSRLEMVTEPSAWLVENNELGLKDLDLMSYLATELDKSCRVMLCILLCIMSRHTRIGTEFGLLENVRAITFLIK
ncbi:hypothetical protein GCK32_010103 [Trichostrongylus colubriformis]|uniref:Uncharacterized protein n=1 Tax=Trichostrongylus colubriformis TaxID=6319 RepID=A0AAN8FRP8_TRICO